MPRLLKYVKICVFFILCFFFFFYGSSYKYFVKSAAVEGSGYTIIPEENAVIMQEEAPAPPELEPKKSPTPQNSIPQKKPKNQETDRDRKKDTEEEKESENLENGQNQEETLKEQPTSISLEEPVKEDGRQENTQQKDRRQEDMQQEDLTETQKGQKEEAGFFTTEEGRTQTDNGKKEHLLKQTKRWGFLVICLALSYVLLSGIFIMVYFLLSPTLYYADENGELKRGGRLLLKKSGDAYRANIPKRKRRSEAGEYHIVFSKQFMKRHHGKALVIQSGEEEIEVLICKNLIFHMEQ